MCPLVFQLLVMLSVSPRSSDAWLCYAKTGRSIRKADQLSIQTKAALGYSAWSPVPIMVEIQEERGD